MFCSQCGVAIQPGQRYCAGCGRPLEGAPVAPPTWAPQSRVEGNLKLLAVFWIVISVFRLIPGLFLFTMFQVGTRFLPGDIPFFVPAIIHAIGLFFVAGAAVGLFAGWGLYNRQPWARTFTVVLGFISLIDIPFGTVLGIYTLWVLLPADAEAEYRRLSLSDPAR